MSEIIIQTFQSSTTDANSLQEFLLVLTHFIMSNAAMIRAVPRWASSVLCDIMYTDKRIQQ